jgi:phosphinothricin acetyltransferase
MALRSDSPITDVRIRDSRDEDLPAITALYAHHVTHGAGSFEIDAPDLATMRSRRAEVLAHGFAWLVAEDAAGMLLGYTYANFFRIRPAYRFTVEDSIYVQPHRTGQGIGRALLSALIHRCEAAGCRQMVALIGDSANRGSIGVHRACGFRAVGTLQATGWKFERWHDTVIMQRALGEGDHSAPDPLEA